ncbi:hypothetical protein SAMN05192583_2053 [Sphingomonas gellani]|uniref:Uncharacterized protein n=1 Tax=Sphingomonas gellani TaxID=1166340 RepID=A0A1H8DTQ5_9SPHN|nr:hypothetical protein [Sphingomonas gellani]SEN10600.1 hypothetical protein SAMN05192583_2053 [Sphingomonas gellani]
MILDHVRRELSQPLPAQVREAAARLGKESGAEAVLFYGSVLRSGQLDDVLDFYVLTRRNDGSVVRRAASRAVWPDVGWRELAVHGRTIRAKVATMTLATFRRAASGRTLDTTIWARFAQPCALAWSASPAAADMAVDAVAEAIRTAARFAAALGPTRGTPIDFWRALFAETYRSELRVERHGRGDQIVDHAADRYAALLPMAWRADGLPFREAEGQVSPQLPPGQSRRLKAAWARRRRAGKAINIARLLKAAFTFDGATRYALYKIERHTGVAIEATPWRERHPVLAAPGVLWRVFRARARADGGS